MYGPIVSICAYVNEPVQHGGLKSHIFVTNHQCGAFYVNKTEISRLQSYFRKLFGLDTIVVQGRVKNDGSAEVSIGGEFIGVVFRDEDEGEVSYAFNMAILEMDLADD